MVNKRVVLVVSLALVIFAYTTFAEVRFIRKSWDAYTPQEKDLYKKAVTAAMQSGHHLLFTKITMEIDGLEQVRNTRAEPVWYRKWLVGYETMLQSQGNEFRSVTLPYWNVFEDAAKRLSSRVSCNSLVACSSFLTDLGAGNGAPYASQYTVNGLTAQGNCANKSIAAAACTSVTADHVCEHCIPRGDWDIEQSTFEFGPSAFVEVLRHAVASDTPMDTLRTSIATRFHYILHNLLGGLYETKAAAFDPIFIGHYTMIDLIYTIYQRCHPTDKTETSSVSLPMVLEGHPVEFHPIVGSFFDGTLQEMGDTRMMDRGYDYELDGFLQTMLDTFLIGGQESLRFTQDLSLTADREASQGFVKAIAMCNASTLTGTTDEAPYTAIVCELMSKQQNGVYTNFSTTTRDAWNVPSVWLPTCVPLLESIAKGRIQLQVTDVCRQAFMNETSISTNDFSTKKYGLAIVTRGKDGFVKRVPGSLGR